ncbi:MAG: hypothetical protein ABJA94_10100 [Rhodoglobus sp.]
MLEKTAKGNDLQRGERLQIMLEETELKAVDDFRYQNRMPSRAAAVRELLRRGLAAVGYGPASTTDSSAFGVIDTPSSIGGGGR